MLAGLIFLAACFCGCGKQDEAAEIQVFAAASLNSAMEELKELYEADHENTTITINADSSGTLMNQIKEGYACDIFFSAAEKQMDELEADGLLVDGTRVDLLNNQLVVVSRKDSGTAVTGLETLDQAESIALANETVPAGKYTRQALISLGILSADKDADQYTGAEVSDALGGVSVSDQDNVSKAILAVVEGSCEVGTSYYSDIYGYEDQVDVLEVVPYDLTGVVSYPVARVQNDEASEAQTKQAQEFYEFLLSDQAKAVFDSYYFDTDVE
jgi:molybdate transport system substrate-binding protein